MRYTQMQAGAFEKMQLNAGIFVDDFDPDTGEIGNILFATSGGGAFADAVEYTDYGEDVDNCPANMMELKRITSRAVTMSGTALTVTAATAKRFIGAADINGNKITPRDLLSIGDFGDLWWVGDYSDKNGNTNGGFVAIHLLNALSTGGFQLQSTDDGKGRFAFELTGHYSMSDINKVPYEVYVKAGEAEAGDYYMTVTSAPGTTSGKTAITASESAGTGSYQYMTGYNLSVPSEGTMIGGSAWSSWDGSAEITAVTGMDIVVVVKDTENKAIHGGKATVHAAE